MGTCNRSRAPGFYAVAKSLAALTVAGLLCSAGEAAAQDSQYWTQQYGPRASLLSGAVIGSVGDISGTFYNPGALGLADELAFAISAMSTNTSPSRSKTGPTPWMRPSAAENDAGG